MGPFSLEKHMELIALQDFSWAHGGVRVEEFKKDQVIETEDADLIEVASREGWAEPVKPAEPEQPADEATAPQPEAKPTKTNKSK